MKIKICGLTRLEEMDFIKEAKPDFIGFVFAASRRQVTFQEAARLRENVAAGIAVVGVFVQEPVENVAGLLRDGVIDVAQLHGGETEAYLARLREKTTQPLIQAVRVENVANLEAAQESLADFLLFDHQGGGTGKSFDWAYLRHFQEQRRREGKTWKPFFLAGGMDVGKVDLAREFQPFAIDLSSGVETDGRKDRRKILEVVRRVRHGK